MREQRIPSVIDLAKQAEVARNTIYNWEDGTTVPSVFELGRVAEVLGLRPSDLVDAWWGIAPPSAGMPALLATIDRKLDLLLVTGGIDPVDAEDEDEARRLIEKARALLAQRGRANAES